MRASASRRSVASRFSKAATTSDASWHSPPNPAHVVCAISENLARETCAASLDLLCPTQLHVTKQGNGQSYAETLACLDILRPHEILLNEGRSNSPLARKILETFHTENGEGCVVKFISRSFFDQTRGAELLRRVSRADTYDPTIVEEYILLSSVHAVLHYTQTHLGGSFARNSLFLCVNAGGLHRMTIDRSSILQLELLVNAKTAKVANSLIGCIDRTKTTVGSRLLRSNLMSPSSSIGTIQTRLELVDIFLGNADFFFAIMDHLTALPDVDKMLSNIVFIPKDIKEDPAVNIVQRRQAASRGISALVSIKTTLSSLPSLALSLNSHLETLLQRFGQSEQDQQQDDDLRTVRTDRSTLLVGLGGSGEVRRFHLLKAILFTVSQPELDEVLQVVNNIFTEHTHFTRSNHAMRHKECFALKCDEADLMTVLRQTFLRNVDDIHKKADEYAEIYNFHVQVRYTSVRGYFLAVPAEIGVDLPSVFLQPAKAGRFITCTTEEIASLNARATDNIQDLLLMTHDRIQEALDYARARYDPLAALCDAVALLDMCHSFADHVTLVNTPWSRPIVFERFGEDEESSDAANAYIIRNGHFPIVVAGEDKTYIANDTYAPANKPLTIISGINGSGKSTYLKQIAIITILAQCGSYVPAERASVPIRDQLCCRIGNTDDQEHNISTFMQEMKETAFICNNSNSRSLVLVDELGRATSNEDGVAIAWATCEYLLKKQSITYFVSHYPQMTRLAETYPQLVQNVHLSASVGRASSENDIGEIRYTHKVQPGACDVSADYGVELAAHCGWPWEVVRAASEIHNSVENLLDDDGVCTTVNGDSVSPSNEAVNLVQKISASLESIVTGTGSLSVYDARVKMKELQKSVQLNFEKSSTDRTAFGEALGTLLASKSLLARFHTSKPPGAAHGANALADTRPLSSEGPEGTQGNRVLGSNSPRHSDGDDSLSLSSVSSDSSESDSSSESST
jgi:DNA mismatch repair protein MSH4